MPSKPTYLVPLPNDPRSGVIMTVKPDGQGGTANAYVVRLAAQTVEGQVLAQPLVKTYTDTEVTTITGTPAQVKAGLIAKAEADLGFTS